MITKQDVVDIFCVFKGNRDLTLDIHGDRLFIINVPFNDHLRILKDICEYLYIMSFVTSNSMSIKSRYRYIYIPNNFTIYSIKMLLYPIFTSYKVIISIENFDLLDPQADETLKINELQ